MTTVNAGHVDARSRLRFAILAVAWGISLHGRLFRWFHLRSSFPGQRWTRRVGSSIWRGHGVDMLCRCVPRRELIKRFREKHKAENDDDDDDDDD